MAHKCCYLKINGILIPEPYFSDAEATQVVLRRMEKPGHNIYHWEILWSDSNELSGTSYDHRGPRQPRRYDDSGFSILDIDLWKVTKLIFWAFVLFVCYGIYLECTK